MGDKQIKSDYFCWSTRGNLSEPDGQQRRVHPVCLFREKRGGGGGEQPMMVCWFGASLVSLVRRGRGVVECTPRPVPARTDRHFGPFALRASAVFLFCVCVTTLPRKMTLV